MDAGLVSSLSGALAQAKRVEIISNNIANADTPGFKSDDLIFEEAMQGASRPDNRSEIPEEAVKDSELLSRAGDERRAVLYGAEFTDLKAGGFKRTGNPLDLAIEGNGFLEVLTPSGIRLTRAGNLTLDGGGRLVTRDGFLVLGAGGAGQDPATRALSVGGTDVNIDIEGNIYTSAARGSAQVGTLSLLKVENPSALKKVGGNLFEAPPEAFAKSAAAGRSPASATLDVEPGAAPKPNPLGSTTVVPRVHQHMLEGSNVNSIGEMTRLIEAHRLFDQNSRLMQTLGDLQSRTNEIGRF